ncbi:unnamed protein product [Rhodiola kirilowii]
MCSNSEAERIFSSSSGDESSGSEGYICSAQNFIYPCDNGSACDGDHSFSAEKYRHDEDSSVEGPYWNAASATGDEEVDKPSPHGSPITKSSPSG